MLKVKVVFTAPLKRTIKSTLASFFMRAPYSHVGIVCDYGDLTSQMFHAKPPRVSTIDFPTFCRKNKVVYSYSVHLDVSQNYIDGYIDGCVGKGYSRPQVYLNQVLKVFGVRPVKNGREKVICSELVFTFLNDCGLALHGDVDDVNPFDLQCRLVERLSELYEG